MKIQEKTHQNRRDFSAILVCENCNHTQILKDGYDDRNYHDNVMPKIKCEKCDKCRNDLGITGDYVETVYPAGYVI